MPSNKYNKYDKSPLPPPQHSKLLYTNVLGGYLDPTPFVYYFFNTYLLFFLL